MPTPLPSPYDILPIPYFAWAPSLAVWLILVVAVLVTAILIRISAGKVQADFYGPALDAAIEEIKSILLSPKFNDELELARDKASIVGRRALAAVQSMPFASMGPEEIRAASEDLQGAIKKAALALKDIEELRYQSRDSELSREYIEKFLLALQSLRSSESHG